MLSGEGKDTSEAFQVIDSNRSQLLNISPSNVSAICHVNNDIKSSLTSGLPLDEEADFKLETKIVTTNDPIPQDEWSYSSFDLTLRYQRLQIFQA